MTGLNGRERELGGGCFLERETDVDFESKYSLFLHLCLFFSSSFLLVILCSSLQFSLIFAPLCVKLPLFFFNLTLCSSLLFSTSLPLLYNFLPPVRPLPLRPPPFFAALAAIYRGPRHSSCTLHEAVASASAFAEGRGLQPHALPLQIWVAELWVVSASAKNLQRQWFVELCSALFQYRNSAAHAILVFWKIAIWSFNV